MEGSTEGSLDETLELGAIALGLEVVQGMRRADILVQLSAGAEIESRVDPRLVVHLDGDCEGIPLALVEEGGERLDPFIGRACVRVEPNHPS
jgi:hypothetical protein